MYIIAILTSDSWMSCRCIARLLVCKENLDSSLKGTGSQDWSHIFLDFYKSLYWFFNAEDEPLMSCCFFDKQENGVCCYHTSWRAFLFPIGSLDKLLSPIGPLFQLRYYFAAFIVFGTWLGQDQDYLGESPERLFRYLRFSKRATVGVRATYATRWNSGMKRVKCGWTQPLFH